jgi:hypothetical protein
VKDPIRVYFALNAHSLDHQLAPTDEHLREMLKEWVSESLGATLGRHGEFSPGTCILIKVMNGEKVFSETGAWCATRYDAVVYDVDGVTYRALRNKLGPRAVEAREAKP